MMFRLVAVLVLAQHYEVLSDCGGAPPVNDPPATMVSMGNGHGCAVDSGAVRCWGKNDAGQLGRGTKSAFETTAAAVTLDAPTAQVVASTQFSCARSITGQVSCWGEGVFGQLGQSTLEANPSPVKVSIPVPVVQLAASSDYVLALGSDGRLFGWGNDAEGTLARGDENTHLYPLVLPVVRVAFGHLFTDVAAGQGSACGLDRAGTVWCWGRNTDHQLGTTDGDEQYRAPVKVREGASAIGADAFGGCLIHDGTVACWGTLPLDESGTKFMDALPTDVSLGGERAVRVDEKWFHRCALTETNALWCWGRGGEGQLGTNLFTPEVVPKKVAEDVAQFSVGYFETCYRARSDGAVWCAGANDTGQLGLGDTNRRYVFTHQ